MNQKFVFPRAAYPQLKRILSALYVFRDDIDVNRLAKASNIRPGEISGNFGFLESVGIFVEGSKGKKLTALGEKLCKSIYESNSADISGNWLSLISRNNFFREIESQIRFDDGQDKEEILGKIVTLAGKRPSEKFLITAKTLVDILEVAGFIKLEKRNRRTIIKIIPSASHPYIAYEHIASLKELSVAKFDLTKLINLCEEINKCYMYECLFAVSALTRAFLDHVPPIFGFRTFDEVVSNYTGGRSFREHMERLNKSSRSISDTHLHTVIKKKIVLPNKTQVNFSNDFDVLLSEIINTLSE